MCEHKEFEAECDVNRLTEKEGGKVSGYVADIRIRCAECGARMQFVGVAQGLSYQRPMASADGLELRAPLAVGPCDPQPTQTIEVPYEQYAADGDAVLPQPILASSDDDDPERPPGVGKGTDADLEPGPSEVSDAEFERRAAAELTRDDPPRGPGGQ